MSKSIFMGTVAGVMFLIGMMILGTAEAGSNNYERALAECKALGSSGNSDACDNPILKQGPNHWVNPGHGSGNIGSCSKDGKFCWNIQIGEQNHWGFPIEYYGRRAARLIADGQIEWANMTHSGVMYLGVWSRYDNRPFDCKINVQRRQYHCQSH